MDKELIAILSSRDPRVKPLPSVILTAGEPMDIAGPAAARFAATYSNVAYGWSVSVAFANARQMFPVTPIDRDKWLFRAYMMRLCPRDFHCNYVLDAWSLANLPQARKLKGKVCGMLLAGLGRDPDIHRRDVSDIMQIPYQVIEAFETLFYNVLDRAQDAAYLSEHVYPDSRLVEGTEDYMKQADITDLLRRAGYSQRDLELSTFIAGVGDQSYMSRLASRDDREQELTRQLMGNALLLVSTGALNQRSVGMQRAQTLLAAQRQSGQAVETLPIADAGNYMSDSLAAVLHAHNEQRLAIMQEDAGVFSGVDPLPDGQ